MKKVIIAILLVAALVLSGCNQAPAPAADTTPEPENQPPALPPANEPPVQPPANEPPAQNEPPANPPATNDALESFLSAFGSLPEYKVTYNSVTTGQAAFSGDMTWYFKAPRMRFDVTTQGVASRTFITPEKTVVCSDSGSGETCYDIPSFAGMTPNVDAAEIRENQSAYAVESIGQRSYAGETGNCYRVTHEGATSEYCGTTDGVMLYVKGSAEGATTEMTATSVSRTVTDADVTPPASQSLGGGAGGFPPGFDPSQYT